MARKTKATSYVVVTPIMHDSQAYDRGATFPADAATPEQIAALMSSGALKAQGEPEHSPEEVSAPQEG